ncbi:MAG TPA: flagellar hook-basal body complex protein FliE, partial [Polyangiaceae bacterium]|nr:flagellar hook-basal body complex protein FliE [Polyangiaceae bacterium]
PGISLIAPHQPAQIDPTPVAKDNAAVAKENAAVDPSGGAIFEDLLKNVVGTANDSIQNAEAVGKEFAAGTRDDIHGTMLALSKADIELRLVGNIRNKVVDAFYELWRMQI